MMTANCGCSNPSHAWRPPKCAAKDVYPCASVNMLRSLRQLALPSQFQRRQLDHQSNSQGGRLAAD